ncbi:15-hydroxyprostaglandin dehydrogenase [NAD(+)]-like [Plodia interpunctella]|uniref:15-hydroxyprostaglandin dehydrogenase [NAD(+)]-like n=1 Tax=Plodia interpunctella TaxID=58824 RepID=UPI002368A8B1|nr:15-hydroxyprostaglandin dehydrogenase [NAD(+)]-like [Plodia interpunctella]
MHQAQDKVILITGGAAGIGREVVRAFLQEGAKHVSVLDLDVTNGTNLEKELAAKHGENKIKFYKCDVTSQDLDACYDRVLKELGYIDVVINCAGLLNDSPKAYLKEIAVNVSALIASSMRAYGLMRKDKGGNGGTIINISSIMGLMQSAFVPIYAATKSAVLQFSNGLGMERNYSRSGVRVLTMCFGCTDTSLLQPGKMEGLDKDLEDEMFAILRQLPSQTIDSAVRGLLDAYKNASSGSTWLVTSNKPGRDITKDVQNGFGIMGRYILE